MSKIKSNYVIVFISRNGKEFIQQMLEEDYPNIVKNNGVIVKKEQICDAMLVSGTTGMILAHWHLPEQEKKVGAVEYTHPGVKTVRTINKTVKIDTKPDLGTVPIEPAPPPAEDPVERIKREARERISADIGSLSPSPNAGVWPTPQPASNIDDFDL